MFILSILKAIAIASRVNHKRLAADEAYRLAIVAEFRPKAPL